MKSMNRGKKIQTYLPYFLVLITCIGSYQYKTLFQKFDFYDYYGKYVGKKAYNFKLQLPSGKGVKLEDFRGQFTLLTFGFTKCTGICPLNLYRFQTISEKLSLQEKESLSFIFISFDQIRDNPKEIDLFIKKFDIPNMYGLLSGEETGLEVAQKYMEDARFIPDKVNKNPEYQVRHNGFIYLIDPKGELALIYLQEEIDELKVIADINKLSQEEMSSELRYSKI